MRTIVLTNWMFSGRSGMEMYVRDLALGLKRRGWRPVIFTLQAGPLAEELRTAGVEVVTRPDDLPRDAALIHGHHNFVTLAALLACPKAPGIFVCHTSIFWQEEPPVFPRLLAYVGVDDLCRERVAADLHAPLETVRFIGNSVDLARFPQRAPLPQRPQRALLFSNYAAEHTFLPAVREACRQEAIELDVVGSGVLNQVSDPERVLSQYDLVFAKARCAMESLATGCATVLCGMEGAGSLVMRENFDRLRRDNFGRRCLSQPMTVESLVAGIREYHGGRCTDLAGYARQQLDFEHTLDQWIALYEEVIALPCPQNGEAESAAAAVMLGKLGSPLFRTFELESMKDHLLHEVHRFSAAGDSLRLKVGEHETLRANLQGEVDRLNAQLSIGAAEMKRLREERDKARQKTAQGVTLKGPLSWLWRHRLLRPLAKALGVRKIS